MAEITYGAIPFLYSDSIQGMGFSDNPMVMHIRTNQSQFPTSAVLPELHIRVITEGINHDFTTTTWNNEEISIDISAAFKASLNTRQQSPAEVLREQEYRRAAINATVEWYCVFSANGQQYKSEVGMRNLYCVPGGLSEFVRFKANKTQPIDVIKELGLLSMKPDRGEIVNVGDHALMSGINIDTKEYVTLRNKIGTAGVHHYKHDEFTVTLFHTVFVYLYAGNDANKTVRWMASEELPDYVYAEVRRPQKGNKVLMFKAGMTEGEFSEVSADDFREVLNTVEPFETITGARSNTTMWEGGTRYEFRWIDSETTLPASIVVKGKRIVKRTIKIQLDTFFRWYSSEPLPQDVTLTLRKDGVTHTLKTLRRGENEGDLSDSTSLGTPYGASISWELAYEEPLPNVDYTAKIVLQIKYSAQIDTNKDGQITSADFELTNADTDHATLTLGDGGSDLIVDQAATTRTVYAENNPDRREFFFINSFGVIESVSVLCLESRVARFSTTEFDNVTEPSFIPKNTRINRVTAKPDEWAMSSGNTSREWVEWFCREFLMARKHWMKLASGMLIPVSVKPADSNTLYDKTKRTQMSSVKFTVTSGIRGVG